MRNAFLDTKATFKKENLIGVSHMQLRSTGAVGGGTETCIWRENWNLKIHPVGNEGQRCGKPRESVNGGKKISFTALSHPSSSPAIWKTHVSTLVFLGEVTVHCCFHWGRIWCFLWIYYHNYHYAYYHQRDIISIKSHPISDSSSMSSSANSTCVLRFYCCAYIDVK